MFDLNSDFHTDLNQFNDFYTNNQEIERPKNPFHKNIDFINKNTAKKHANRNSFTNDDARLFLDIKNERSSLKKTISSHNMHLKATSGDKSFQVTRKGAINNDLKTRNEEQNSS